MTTATPSPADGAADVGALLRGIPIFAELDAGAIGRLAGRCVTRTVAAGNVLFTTGEQCRGLYVIAGGRVRIYRTSPEGREQVLHVEGPGRAVAELPLFDGGAYPASAVTLEQTQLVFLPRADFEQLYRGNPDIAHAIIRGLGRRLRHLVQVTQTLAFRDVAARLAMLLADYADRIGTPSAGSTVELVLDRTQEELSLEIGTARESVSRAYRQLRQQGLIESLGGHRLRIPDVERLRALARGG
ncbi:MAG: Crp/Fnr family transcriptional regulator [Gemmatimonadaceae bacterium]